ncbi:hypothetical protein [Hymenobacter sp. BT491]|uniref:hypothetical protein n=1 Tax=Hymenobacter sp. BT491 TaxID=2766779 RepID=UPI001653C9AC|nr:hypothetical protein [Hymenobacter sp. BT491]MBC6988557.1 hypothetical protein [Hymenobacter sp. BT491]
MAKIITSPRKIFDHAESFNKVYNLSASHGRHDESLMFPIASLGAFTLELYFKCLLLEQIGRLNPGEKMTHNLVELFNALPDETKLTISRYSDEFVSRDPDYEAMKQVIPGFSTSVEYFIESGQNAFEEFRYLYESDATSPMYIMGTVVWAARKYILELHPEWASKE